MNGDGPEPRAFGPLLRYYRARSGRSRNSLAHEVGCDPSHWSRAETGGRVVSRALVEAMARGLQLLASERERLLVAAGYIPSTVNQIGRWDESLDLVATVLADPLLSDLERDQFRSVILLIAAKWREGAKLQAQSRRNGVHS